MNYTFLRYLVYECPSYPGASGRYIGQTPIEEQAVSAVKNHNERRAEDGYTYPAWLIYGLTPSGEKVIFL